MNELVQWTAVFIVLIIFYKKIISPFAKRMLEIPTADQVETKQRITFDDDELELTDNSQDLRRKVEKQLNISSADQEEKLRYEVLLEKLRGEIEKNPENATSVIGSLVNNKQ